MESKANISPISRIPMGLRPTSAIIANIWMKRRNATRRVYIPKARSPDIKISKIPFKITKVSALSPVAAVRPLGINDTQAL
jgi:hypothetical protein